MRRWASKRAVMMISGALLSVPTWSQATVIDFDSQGLSGPSFSTPDRHAQTLNITTPIGNVQFSGGSICTNCTNSPADQTSFYATIGPEFEIDCVSKDR